LSPVDAQINDIDEVVRRFHSWLEYHMETAERARQLVAALTGSRSHAELAARLAPRPGPAARLPRLAAAGVADAEARLAAVGAGEQIRAELLDARSRERLELYVRNIEGCIGTVDVPVGLAGPLRVNGVHAAGDYFVPLATTEAALVASYSRGAALMTAAGGAAAVVLNEGVSRTPVFVFDDLFAAGSFIAWLTAHLDEVRAAAEATTRFGRLENVNFHTIGSAVYVDFVYTTGEASGQNMATIATDAACRFILEAAPTAPARHYLEANLSGDKKASMMAFQSVRGRNVTAEAVIPAKLVRRRLGVEIDRKSVV